jgi:hypothetical protein
MIVAPLKPELSPSIKFYLFTKAISYKFINKSVYSYNNLLK